jgi:hypothetical protein
LGAALAERTVAQLAAMAMLDSEDFVLKGGIA